MGGQREDECGERQERGPVIRIKGGGPTIPFEIGARQETRCGRRTPESEGHLMPTRTGHLRGGVEHVVS